MRALLTRILPDSQLARRLSAQSILFAIGEGAFMTGSAVFFTQIVGLSATQVGLGLTIAGAVSFAIAVPSGRLADAMGPRRIWWMSALVIAALYLVYPWIHGFVAFVVLVCVLQVVDGAGSAGRGAYTLDAFPREERVRYSAYMRSALNIGFTLGALLGGLALATGSNTVIRMFPVVTAVVLVVNAFLITRLPATEHEVVQAEERVAKPRVSALRNRGFLGMSICEGVLGTNQALLNVVIPLWLVQETDAPHTLLAWLFGTNTVLAVLLQVPAARGSHTVSGALRATRLCALCFVVSCLLVMATADTLSWVTIVLIWAGHVTVTGAELFQSASQWGFTSELSDPERRGEYQGVSRFGTQIGSIGGPAAYTFLTIHLGMVGWLTIAALAVVATIACHPAARAAQRYLAAEQAAAVS